MLHCPKCGLRYLPPTEHCPIDNSPLQADSTSAGDDLGDPLIGQTLDDKYRIEERLGIGGMGTVYRARHLLIDRAVAVKVLNSRFVEDEAARMRFRREAKAAGRLQHANAVAVTDFGQTSDGYVYIVMELLQGRTLRDVLAKEAPLDPARAVALMLQTSAAVAAAHDAGIIHRDLKPANIFIVQSSEVPAVVKVLDFGIAKLAAESLEDDEDSKTLTLVGAMIGTPRYMSPEQCDGVELTPAADVYSLGVILYEMLTGVVPFSGSTPLAIAMKHANEPPRRPSEFAAGIPLALEEVVLHALEKEPDDRPANAAEFRRELFATAERLGLEHAAVTSAPDIQALRNVGTESPSGRLVIDISRLRENRAAITSSGEMTVMSPTFGAEVNNRDAAGPALSKTITSGRPSFPRLSVPLREDFGWATRKSLILLAGFVALLLIVGVGFFVLNSQSTAPVTEATVTASPSPSIEPTPAPSPTPAATREEKKPPANANANNKKKGSKVGSALKKVGRILKKPF